jgi:hypothetical protein
MSTALHNNNNHPRHHQIRRYFKRKTDFPFHDNGSNFSLLANQGSFLLYFKKQEKKTTSSMQVVSEKV